MCNKKFSIIVPVYNTEEYLGKCIGSLINQTYSNIEIILVNDGSTDNSAKICDEYADKDKRILVLHEPNEGATASINKGLRQSTGDYIIFLDSDDYIDYQSCEVFASIIKKHPGIEMINSKSKSIFNEQIIVPTHVNLEKNMPISGPEYLKLMLKQNRFWMPIWYNIYKRSFLIENNFYLKVGIMAYDFQWTPRVFLAAKSVVSSEFYHHFRHVRTDSMSRTVDLNHRIKRAENHIATCFELEKIFDDLHDIDLRWLLKDKLVHYYFYIFHYGKLYRDSTRHLINKQFLKNNAMRKITKFCVLFFCVSNRLFYFGVEMLYILRRLVKYKVLKKFKD